MMGLADADEVPDMFIVQDTGEREWVSIEQVIAAEGPREPPPAQTQSVFNAAFVYLWS
jgi:hypothetical protein